MDATESTYFRVEEFPETKEYVKVFPKDFKEIPIKKDWGNIPVSKTSRIFSLEGTDLLHDFEVFEDDVWIITNPKCGTTWTQEMCWLILHNLDYKTANSTYIEERSPFIEFSKETLEFCKNLERPRLIKTHQPIQLLPKDIWKKSPKIIYVVRNPRDAFVSMVHHLTFFLGKNAVTDKLNHIKKCMKYNNFYEHVLDYYQLREKENFMFFSFEQMKYSLKNVVLKVCTFLDKSYSNEDIDKLVNHLDFQNMKGELLCYNCIKYIFPIFSDNESCSHRKEFEIVKGKNNLKEEDFDSRSVFIFYCFFFVLTYIYFLALNS